MGPNFIKSINNNKTIKRWCISASDKEKEILNSLLSNYFVQYSDFRSSGLCWRMKLCANRQCNVLCDAYMSFLCSLTSSDYLLSTMYCRLRSFEVSFHQLNAQSHLIVNITLQNGRIPVPIMVL